MGFSSHAICRLASLKIHKKSTVQIKLFEAKIKVLRIIFLLNIKSWVNFKKKNNKHVAERGFISIKQNHKNKNNIFLKS